MVPRCLREKEKIRRNVYPVLVPQSRRGKKKNSSVLFNDSFLLETFRSFFKCPCNVAHMLHDEENPVPRLSNVSKIFFFPTGFIRTRLEASRTEITCKGEVALEKKA